MTNHYSFFCPVHGTKARISHCESVHSSAMKGRQGDVEDKLCAAAHSCFLCPFRTAVRVGGPWSKPGTVPFQESDTDRVEKLDPGIVIYAMQHTLPTASDLRRARIPDSQHISIIDDLRTAQAPFLNKTAPTAKVVKSAARPARKPAQPRASKTPETAVEAIASSDTDLAKGITDVVKLERSQKAPQTAQDVRPTQDASKSKQRTHGRRIQGQRGDRPLTLSERAKLMKERKEASQ